MRVRAGCRTGIGRQRHALERAAQRLAVGLGHVEMHGDTALIGPDHVHRRAVDVASRSTVRCRA